MHIPRDVIAICVGKSTYARCGIIVNVTPLEPEWEGHVTLEFSNTTPLPAKIYANEGACQFLFLQGNEPCEVSYADRAQIHQIVESTKSSGYGIRSLIHALAADRIFIGKRMGAKE